MLKSVGFVAIEAPLLDLQFSISTRVKHLKIGSLVLPVLKIEANFAWAKFVVRIAGIDGVRRPLMMSNSCALVIRKLLTYLTSPKIISTVTGGKIKFGVLGSEVCCLNPNGSIILVKMGDEPKDEGGFSLVGAMFLLGQTYGGKDNKGSITVHLVLHSCWHFSSSEVDDEAVLSSLWERYENTADKEEKKRLFHVFLKQFLIVFKNWEPVNYGQLPEAASTAIQPGENSTSGKDIVGCFAGHPSEIILTLTEEILQLTTLVSEINPSAGRTTTDLPASTISFIITSEGLPVLYALKIIARSLHNCRVFGYYDGIQKLTALMKGAVIQLKTMTGSLSVNENLSNFLTEKIGFLQRVLVYVVSIMCSLIDLDSNIYEKAQMYNITEGSYEIGASSSIDSSNSLKGSLSKARLHWHQKAIVSVMEAGGLNWLVELMRVMRRLSMKEQWTDMPLQCLTLRTLCIALSNNSRGQNHFKSIGGLEVLLDGLALPPINMLLLKSDSNADGPREKNTLLKIFELHVLSLEVLREAVFENVSNLQFLCENERVHKFANGFCSPAFMLQEYKQQMKDSFMQQDGNQASILYLTNEDNANSSLMEPSIPLIDKASCVQLWNDCIVKLSKVLCSFLLAPEDVKSHHEQISSIYGELSIKWVIKVLLVVFPSIKTCAYKNELPRHLWVFINTLQHCVLKAFKKILTSSPTLLEVFRKAGIWDLIFSENFFYLGSASEEPFKEISTYNERSLEKLEKYSSCWSNVVQLKDNGVGTIQREVITFVELVATSNGSLNNLPELSALIKALEQCACNPEIASVLAKSLLQILQQSVEKTIASFNSLNAVSRVLKVASILAQESKQSSNISLVTDNNYLEGFPANGLQRFDSREIFIIEGTETCMEIFKEFFSVADDAKSLILHDSTCIDCLFELFWEEGYKNHVLKYILDLMKVVSLSGEDRKAMLYVCSKYLETFNLIKEKEKRFAELSINLLNGMMDILQTDLVHYQALFRDGGCFLHVVSLLNGTLDEAHGEMLVLVVLQTLTSLLARNDASKVIFISFFCFICFCVGLVCFTICNDAFGILLLFSFYGAFYIYLFLQEVFRALVGKGYQTLQSLLLDFCQWHPSEALLNALLDMLVDGKFDIKDNPHIKNEDVIILYLSVLQKSSESLRHYGLGVFQQLLRDSLSNRASCVVAGMLNFLLDWFVQEGDDSVILKMAQLIQVIGGYSISGKDIRKIFALLRSEKVGTQLQYCSLLLTTVLSMLNEKGPTTFFDLNGNDSGIIIKTPVHWPLYKGFSFSCWLRVEDFPKNGTMGLFKFFTENRRGFLAAVAKDKLIYKLLMYFSCPSQSINLKQYSIQTHVNLVKRKWHFLCITHTIGRAFSGGSLFRCYLDGNLVSSERCRYAKVSELLTNCSIGTNMVWPQSEDNTRNSNPDFLPFFGQIGPLYLFADVISSEQVKAVHSLGPSYMYSFLDNEATAFGVNPLPSGILEAKDGLASKIVFGLNAQVPYLYLLGTCMHTHICLKGKSAFVNTRTLNTDFCFQASDGKKLFNVSPVLDHALDKNLFEATIKVGTQLCSRRLFKEIIYCVGGVSVFFPLISQSDRYENDEIQVLESTLVLPVAKERLTAEVIELVASVLDENLANQQQMHLLSGFSILGFLLQSVPPQQLNMETLSALKNLFNVVSSCGLAELLIEEIISSIFLNPLTWLYTVYKVQCELYMFLIEQFDNDPRLLKSLCQFPRVIDIIRQCYWDNVKSRFAIGGQPLLHPITKQVIGERPSREEIQKIRLLLLSLGEMSLRQSIAPADIKALIAFFETSHDMTCIEDILNMVIRAVSQKPLLMSFLEHVNLIGGCRIFVNLLQREYEPIRLLSLQFIGRLLVGFPLEKKATRFFNLAVGRTKPLSENNKKVSSRLQPLFSVISDRLFKFPQTDNLCSTLFDVLLGGASPKQVLQKNSTTDKQRSRGKTSHFFLPQMLVLIFRFLSGCKDASARMKIISDLLELLDSNTLNIEALMEYGWNAWLTASVTLDIVKPYRPDSRYCGDYEANEKNLVMKVFSVVLCHYVQFVKSGWQRLEETVNFLLVHCEQVGISCQDLLYDIYDNLIQRLVDLSSEENIFSSQPCRDNTLYFLRLVDEMLISEAGIKLLFPAISSESFLDSLMVEGQKDYTTLLHEVLRGEFDDKVSGNALASEESITSEDDITNDKWWNLFDNLWIVISEMNGKGPSKMLPRITVSVGPSFGQRARDLVESLNIPATEMAAVVISGGFGNALSGKQNKVADKAMALRGERCPRIVFRLLIIYLCRASLERASRCVQQFISLLPSFLGTDDEQSKSRLQLFIWSLLLVRSRYGKLDDGARFHVIAHVIRETVNSGKSMLATSMIGRDDLFNTSSLSRETGSLHNLIQKDRVLSAVTDESKYVKMLESDRSRRLQELRAKMDENSSSEINTQKTFEDEIQSSLCSILASDESRRAAFLLAHEEEQQNVAVC
ncbi:BEACH domain-containing protein B-like isoform X3 [Gossypium australe]|uniref:BEACH domain-containing protein B-like isoform X3 n=1 Tax=Gossypium australe TaxID=47621 RepID=A0A5B6W5T6_9ROSI|nr:BEACH domain-containing protein B-like isoform X3 [Gossypium australe]